MNLPKLSIAARLYTIFALMAATTVALSMVAVSNAHRHAALTEEFESANAGSWNVERINGLIYASTMETRGIYMSADRSEAIRYADALIKVTTTTICGTDVHILKGEYPVARGLTVGHEPVGVIHKLGSAVQGYREGQRVIAGAITPSGWSNACQCGCGSQDGAGTAHGWKPLGVLCPTCVEEGERVELGEGLVTFDLGAFLLTQAVCPLCGFVGAKRDR